MSTEGTWRLPEYPLLVNAFELGAIAALVEQKLPELPMLRPLATKIERVMVEMTEHPGPLRETEEEAPDDQAT